MNPNEPSPPSSDGPDTLPAGPAVEPLTVTAAAALAQQKPALGAAPAAAKPGGLEGALERVAAELMRHQRAERQWRVFFRLAWLGLALVVLWLSLAGRGGPSAPSTPHTALVEVRGEIAAGNEASA